jgi:hypothetical protein
MIRDKRRISVLRLFNESRYKTIFCFGMITTALQWFALRYAVRMSFFLAYSSKTHFI